MQILTRDGSEEDMIWRTRAVRFPENIWLRERVSFENCGSDHDVGSGSSIFWRRVSRECILASFNYRYDAGSGDCRFW